MNAFLAASVTFWALIGHIPQVAALTLAEIGEEARPSTVHISYDATDPETGAVSVVNGSGFVVSSSGYVMTAYHVLEPWMAQPEAQRLQRSIMVRLGSIHNESLTAELVEYNASATVGGGADLAVLRIRRSATYATADFCYIENRPIGSRIFAFGFPAGQELNYAEGAIANPDGVGDRWTANINFDYGMSGGPVYDDLGRVIGVVKGGMKGVQPVRYITRLLRARSLLIDYGIDVERCDNPSPATSKSAQSSNSVIPTLNNSECNKIGFTDYSTFPPTFKTEVVCSEGKP
ncbi:serine protease [Aurantimonas sp. E1-2-R+4]|uniref:S1 family peptidase n=1 Tax=Aurantimonas sp. E1-2-R+4 TaxID=3113714 RepID=UPI002F946212